LIYYLLVPRHGHVINKDIGLRKLTRK